MKQKWVRGQSRLLARVRPEFDYFLPPLTRTEAAIVKRFSGRPVSPWNRTLVHYRRARLCAGSGRNPRSYYVLGRALSADVIRQARAERRRRKVALRRADMVFATEYARTGDWVDAMGMVMTVSPDLRTMLGLLGRFDGLLSVYERLGHRVLPHVPVMAARMRPPQ